MVKSVRVAGLGSETRSLGAWLVLISVRLEQKTPVLNEMCIDLLHYTYTNNEAGTRIENVQ